MLFMVVYRTYLEQTIFQRDFLLYIFPHKKQQHEGLEQHFQVNCSFFIRMFFLVNRSKTRSKSRQSMQTDVCGSSDRCDYVSMVTVCVCCVAVTGGELQGTCCTPDEARCEDLDWEEEREMERLACEGDDFIPPKIMVQY